MVLLTYFINICEINKIKKFKAIRIHIDDEDRKNYGNILGGVKTTPPKFDIQTVFINESGLYSLILRSNLPTAKEFKRWITSVVLPLICIA